VRAVIIPSVPAAVSAAGLLAWYDRHRRVLPWRAAPGETIDPYHVWLSEIMLQQTTVAAVIPYYRRFLDRFPDVRAMAAAPLDDVLAAWAGLGYYARARNMHACAKLVSASGGFPRDVASLRALPGVGPYTAAAVAAIAFGVPGVPVDGNVERVSARVFAIEAPLPGARPAIAAAAASLGADPAAAARPSDFAQALFDLGATVCTPASPACGVCPWMAGCLGRAQGVAAELPRKTPRAARPVRHGAHFWLQDEAGRVLLSRRAEKGLLGGMTELPGTQWRAAEWPQAEALAHAPTPAGWRRAGRVRHVFTHFELLIDVYAATVPEIAGGMIRHASELEKLALPSVMRRCVEVAQAASRPELAA
jgi:A/G-specific adenine glycosylase